MSRKILILILSTLLVISAIVSVGLFGCGGGGTSGSTVSDKVWYVLNVTIPMNSANARSCGPDVDAFPDTCSDGTFLVDHTTPATFTLTRVDPATDPGILQLQSYTIQYVPMNPSSPVIPSFTVYQTEQLKEGDNTITLEVMDVARKTAFAALFSSGQQSSSILPVGYTASYTFNGQNSYGQTWTYQAQAPIFVGEYNECATCSY